jgi:hypothetical protein
METAELSGAAAVPTSAEAEALTSAGTEAILEAVLISVGEAVLIGEAVVTQAVVAGAAIFNMHGKGCKSASRRFCTLYHRIWSTVLALA